MVLDRAPVSPEEFQNPGLKGGRPWRHPREILKGVLWVLRK